MTTTRRWLKSAIAASAAPQPTLPWDRSARRKPAALHAALHAAPVKPQAMAAR